MGAKNSKRRQTTLVLGRMKGVGLLRWPYVFRLLRLNSSHRAFWEPQMGEGDGRKNAPRAGRVFLYVIKRPLKSDRIHPEPSCHAFKPLSSSIPRIELMASPFRPASFRMLGILTPKTSRKSRKPSWLAMRHSKNP